MYLLSYSMKSDFRRRFIICLLITVPVVLLTTMVEGGYWIDGKYFFHGNVYLVFMLSSFVFFYGFFPFLKELFSGGKKLKVLVIVGSAIYLYNILVLFGAINSTVVLFWELVVLIDIMLLGFWIGTKNR